MEEWITRLKEEFRQTVAEEDKYLVAAFEDYLRFVIKSIKESDAVMIKKDTNSIGQALQFITRKIIHADLESKKQILLKDEKMDYLKKLSDQAYSLALETSQGRAVEVFFDIAERMQEMEEMQKEVQDYNQSYAKQLVSEGILDLRYVQNPQTNIYSLRLGRELQRNQNQQEAKNG